jgi:DNA-binding NarL/FixJ family response regulator
MGVREKIRVAVIDPYPLFRQGIVQTIVHAGALALVAEGATWLDAQRAAREHRPDVLIIDIGGLPDGGVDGVPEFLKSAPDSKLVVLTSLDDVPSVAKALAAGIQGRV